METGWSQKRLIKSILSSETYQQSSNLRPDLTEKDPRNTLLARGPRFRADAEIVRDIALAASGLLNPEIGGPSVFPPVPESMLKDNYQPVHYWIEATDEQRYRRSLYIFRKRAMPDPALSSFDAPNADASCVRRILSNTPLSALTSLNEPVFVEAAQGMGLRILKEGGDQRRIQNQLRLPPRNPDVPPAKQTPKYCSAYSKNNAIDSPKDGSTPAKSPSSIPTIRPNFHPQSLHATWPPGSSPRAYCSTWTKRLTRTRHHASRTQK